eukprot:20334-Heterococcus_DN1.PRE.3
MLRRSDDVNAYQHLLSQNVATVLHSLNTSELAAHLEPRIYGYKLTALQSAAHSAAAEHFCTKPLTTAEVSTATDHGAGALYSNMSSQTCRHLSTAATSHLDCNALAG